MLAPSPARRAWRILAALTVVVLAPLGAAALQVTPIAGPPPPASIWEQFRSVMRTLETDGMGLLLTALLMFALAYLGREVIKALATVIRTWAAGFGTRRSADDVMLQQLTDALSGLLRQQATGSGEARRDRREIADDIKATVVGAVQDAVKPLVEEISALKCHVEQLNHSCQQQHADTAAHIWGLTHGGAPLPTGLPQLAAPMLDKPGP